MGFEFEYLITGPVTLYKKNGKLSLSQNPSWELVGGITRSYLPNKNRLRKKLIAYYLGGPITSLVLAITFLVSDYVFNLDFLYSSFLLNLLLFFATILPLGKSTDGAGVLALWKNDLNSKRFMNDYLLENELLSFRRPRDWDSKTVDFFKNVDAIDLEESNREMVHTLLYYYETDTGNDQEKLTALYELMNFDISKDIKEILYSTIILFEFIHSNNIKNRSHLKEMYSKLDPQNDKNKYGYSRAKCIMHWIDGKEHLAKEDFLRLEALYQDLNSESLVKYGYLKAEKEWNQKLKSKVNLGI